MVMTTGNGQLNEREKRKREVGEEEGGRGCVRVCMSESERRKMGREGRRE